MLVLSRRFPHPRLQETARSGAVPLMSDNHTTICEQDARHESFVAELTGAANLLVLRRGLKGSWTRAAHKTASQRMARRTMDLAVLLVLGMAASETQAVLMSVFRTLKQRGHNPVSAVLDAVRASLKTSQLPPLPRRITENG